MKVSSKVLITAIAIVAPISLGATAETITTNPTLETMVSSTSYSNILSPADFKSQDINLTKGRPIAEGIPIGATKLKDFSPATAIAATGSNLDLSTVQLSELKFLKETPLKSVVAANPSIATLPAKTLGWVDGGDKTLGELATSNLGQNPLPESVLKSTSIGQFGDIANTPYSSYTEAAKQPIANFLGAGNIPLSKLTNIASTASAGKVIEQITVDRINTKEIASGINARISSGSNKEPHAPCTQAANNCNVLEIRGQTKGVIGSLWMIDQKLKGGSGLIGEMATAAGIREYAGYEIPGTDFKVVAISDDARAGTAQLRLDMRISSMFGSTPFFLPVLPMTVSEQKGQVALPVEITPVASTMAKSGTASNPTTPTQPSTGSATTVPTAQTDNPNNQNNSQPSTGSATNVLATPTTGNSQPNTKSVTNVPTARTDNLNNQNGNIGRAVKTNAINPAVGGLL
jgi:hypothetical protein